MLIQCALIAATIGALANQERELLLEDIKLVENAPHGYSKMSGEKVLGAFKRILDSPGPYLGLIRERVSCPKAYLEFEKDAVCNRICSMILLLGRIGTKEACDNLGDSFASLTQRLSKIKADLASTTDGDGKRKLVGVQRRVSFLRDRVVERLGALGDGRIVAGVLTAIESDSQVNTVIYTEYLVKVCNESESISQVVKRLKAIRDSDEEGLRDSKALIRAIGDLEAKR